MLVYTAGKFTINFHERELSVSKQKQPVVGTEASELGAVAPLWLHQRLREPPGWLSFFSFVGFWKEHSSV